MPIVRWTDEERTRVVAEVVRLRRKDLVQSLPILLNLAQEHILPKNRQRSRLTLQSCGAWFVPAVRAAFDASQEETLIEVEKIVELPLSIKSIPTPVLLAEVVLRLATKLDQVDQLFPAPPPVNGNGHGNGHALPTLGQALTQAAEHRTVRQPHVVIMGVIADQPKYVTDRLGQHCQFTFIAADDGKHAGLPKDADKAYMLAKFSNHAVGQRMRSQYGDRYHVLHGGVGTLIATIAKDLHIPL